MRRTSVAAIATLALSIWVVPASDEPARKGVVRISVK
jgi:hypothetical protein